jgi:hypothetical protein
VPEFESDLAAESERGSENNLMSVSAYVMKLEWFSRRRHGRPGTVGPGTFNRVPMFLSGSVDTACTSFVRSANPANACVVSARFVPAKTSSTKKSQHTPKKNPRTQRIQFECRCLTEMFHSTSQTLWSPQGGAGVHECHQWTKHNSHLCCHHMPWLCGTMHGSNSHTWEHSN